jgi:hypothetical protein
MQSWLAGVALSTTSVAVVYSVMLELGSNRTDFGKGVLAACFVNDLGTVIALGLIFSPFTLKALVFIVVSVAVFAILPFITPPFFKSDLAAAPELATAKRLVLQAAAMLEILASGRHAKPRIETRSRPPSALYQGRAASRDLRPGAIGGPPGHREVAPRGVRALRETS